MKAEDFLKDERALAEIEKHKWFESEKAGHDIGFDAAAADWIERFGKEWAKYHCSQACATEKRPAAKSGKARRKKD